MITKEVISVNVVELKELQFVDFCITDIVALSQYTPNGHVFSSRSEGRPDNILHVLMRGHYRYTDQDGNVLEAGRDEIIYVPRNCLYTVEGIAAPPLDGVRSLRVSFQLTDREGRPFTLFPTVTCLGYDTTGEFKTCMQEMRDVYAAGRNTMALKSLLYDVLDKLVAQTTAKDLTIEHCGDYIRQNLTGNLTIAHLADRYRVSEATFRKRFKEYYGVTPVRYINENKMEMAKELLRVGDISTEEIVRLLGFYDTSYFYKRMKNECGMTPADYRRHFRTPEGWLDKHRKAPEPKD